MCSEYKTESVDIRYHQNIIQKNSPKFPFHYVHANTGRASEMEAEVASAAHRGPENVKKSRQKTREI